MGTKKRHQCLSMIVHKHRAPCYCLVCVRGVLGLQRFCTGEERNVKHPCLCATTTQDFRRSLVYICKRGLSNLFREQNSEVCMVCLVFVYGCACCKKMCRKDEGELLGADESRTNRSVGQAVHMRNPSRMGCVGVVVFQISMPHISRRKNK